MPEVARNLLQSFMMFLLVCVVVIHLQVIYLLAFSLLIYGNSIQALHEIGDVTNLAIKESLTIMQGDDFLSNLILMLIIIKVFLDLAILLDL